jgi:hypothetical protein
MNEVLMNRSAKLSIAAGVAIASLLVGCGPSVPEHDQQGGIMSGNEIAAERAKHDTLVDRTPVGVQPLNTAAAPASTRHLTTAPAPGTLAAPAAAETAPPPGTAAPAGNVSPADAPVGSPPAPSAVPVAPAPVAPAPAAPPAH